MGRLISLILLSLYISITSYVIYWGLYNEDKEFVTHLKACFAGTEPSQIFRVTDPMMEKLHPHVSFQKYHSTVPFHLKCIYILTYWWGSCIRIVRSTHYFFWGVFQQYVMQKSLGTNPGELQGRFNRLAIDVGKFFLPFTTMSF